MKTFDFGGILKFLQDLSKNNNRDWFERNKGTYLKSKSEFDGFLAELLKEFIKLDKGLAGLDPKKLAFRIYRDVRFSKDKSPYKINMGAGFSPGGKMTQEPGYYIHIQPGNKSFLAGGLYMPDPGNLSKIRQEIDYNADALNRILDQRKFKKIFPALDDFDKLKTVPKGYPKDHPQIDLLKHKSFLVSGPFSDKEVRDKNFLKAVSERAKIIRPLNEFLKEAIS
jgi:uncharacterized protein (TIGR02453 family)